MQVFERLHWLNGGMSNAWLYEDEDGWVLVDTGMPRKIDAVGYLSERGVPARALKHIVITHADVDHVGGLARTLAATGATVYAGAATAELLAAGQFPSHGYALIDRLTPWIVRVEGVSAEKNHRHQRWRPTACTRRTHRNRLSWSYR